MPYSLETWKNKAIVVDTKGHHYSNDPISMEKARRQMRLLQMIEHTPDQKKRKK
jgi:hypothetical protein